MLTAFQRPILSLGTPPLMSSLALHHLALTLGLRLWLGEDRREAIVNHLKTNRSRTVECCALEDA